MSDRNDLDILEQVAYEDSYSDGIIDLFFGVSVAWIGAAWLWLPDFAGLAGVFPAVFVVPMLELRKRFVEPRAGLVRWSAARRERERRGYGQVFILGALVLAAGVAGYVWSTRGDVDPLGDLVSGLPALLLAAGAVAVALAIGVRRVFGYAALLAATGTATVASGADPGLDMLASGVAVSAVALYLVVTFSRRHPPQGDI